MNTAPKESVPQTNAGEQEREPEVRKCFFCGKVSEYYLVETSSGWLCAETYECRDRLVDQLVAANRLLDSATEEVVDLFDIIVERDAEIAALREMLRIHQWSGAEGHGWRECPECLVDKDNDDGLHHPDCALAALIATKPGSAHEEAPTTGQEE